MNQENLAMKIKLCLAGVLGTLTALWGWFGWLVLVWAALMLADWLIGSAVAAKDGKWSSEKMRAGAWHKGGIQDRSKAKLVEAVLKFRFDR